MRKAVLVVLVAVLGLLPATALGTSTKIVKLKAALTGEAEVPQEGQAGTGRVTLTLNSKTGRICWKFARLRHLGGKAAAAHIHKGREGKAGAVVVPLGDSFRARGCTTVAKRLVRAILAKPRRYYVNVHNAAYPAGAARGQLERT